MQTLLANVLGKALRASGHAGEFTAIVGTIGAVLILGYLALCALFYTIRLIKWIWVHA